MIDPAQVVITGGDNLWESLLNYTPVQICFSDSCKV